LKYLFISLPIFLFFGSLAFGAPSKTCQIEEPSPSIPPIKLELIASDLRSPVGLTHAGDGTRRLFIIEQDGTIRIWKDGRIVPKPFLEIKKRVESGGEKGLLGLTFHPDFYKNKRFFVNYTSSSKGLHTVISEFKVGKNKNQADPESEKILLTIKQPYGNHNGGNIAFGKDGFLYIGTGDGGSGNDPFNNGQDLSSLLGKMLRIDVDQKGNGLPYAIPKDNPFIKRTKAALEIWAFGLRNPWRFSFDPVTGLLYAGDVGQNTREEIDIIEKGQNYGWRIMEGKICTPGINRKCKKKNLQLPILDYSRSQGTTVIGGYVYRGHSIPGLCGTYLYADFGSGNIFGFRHKGKKVTLSKLIVRTNRSFSSFGEDENHELFMTDYSGDILKLVQEQLPLEKKNLDKK